MDISGQNYYPDEDEVIEYVPKLSKLQEEYMEKAKQRQKEGIVKPQVVAGREFKGTAFISKPDKIIFKDFTVGISHTQTILVTNVSFSFNSFKLLPLNDNIKDFFQIQYTPTGRMSAGLSTQITITFTPQLNQDIFGVFPILSETGPIDIPLECTCKKALLSVDDPMIDFGPVIYGEQCTKTLRIKNDGALPTKVFIKTNDGQSIPFVNQDELNKKLEQQNQILLEQEQAAKNMDLLEEKQEDQQNIAETINYILLQLLNIDVAAQDDIEFQKEENNEQLKIQNNPDGQFELKGDPLEQFLSQVQFITSTFQVKNLILTYKRTQEIEGYSSIKISFTFVPLKLGQINQDFTIFFDNQDYSQPIPITIKGECVDVPIYVEKPEYNMNVLVYEQFYREKIILYNRSAQPMKIQLYFPKSFNQK